MLFLIILEDIPLLKSRTCRRIYFIKASDDQRSISMIIYTGVSPMNMAIAAAERLECVPISSGSTPILSFPILCVFVLNASRMSSCMNTPR